MNVNRKIKARKKCFVFKVSKIKAKVSKNIVRYRTENNFIELSKQLF